MNLETGMRLYTANLTEAIGEETINITDAIKIAKEYATEMCKRQREICADSSFKIHKLGLADILPEREREQMNKIIGRMITAPLATEEEK